MENFIQKIKEMSLKKIIGLLFVAMVLFTLGYWVLETLQRSVGDDLTGTSMNVVAPDFAPGSAGGRFGGSPSSAPAYRDNGFSADSLSETGMEKSLPPIGESPIVGSDAEDFEITDYSADIRTWKLDSVCGSIEGLKKEKKTIFESARRYIHGCSYSFKVEKTQSDKVLAFIKELKPETVDESTQTIKSTIEYYTNEEDIQKKRLELVENALLEAEQSYSEIQKFATSRSDISSLTQLVQNKLLTINLLTNERLNTKVQIDRLAKEKAKQLDILQYTFFNVSVTELVLVDGKNIKNEWIRSVSELTYTFNNVARGITTELLGFILLTIKWGVYLLFLVAIVKYGWIILRRIWRDDGRPLV